MRSYEGGGGKALETKKKKKRSRDIELVCLRPHFDFAPRISEQELEQFDIDSETAHI